MGKIDFWWPVTSEASVVHRFIKEKIAKIAPLIKDKKIIIFGAGIRGCEILLLLERDGFADIIFCDNNPQKQGNLIRNYDIISVEDAEVLDCGKVFLISFENSDCANKQLESYGLKLDKDFYSFDISLYDKYVNEYIKSVNNHGLFFGDCAFTHIALDDKITDSLGDMLEAVLFPEHCKVMSMHGLGQRAHYNVIKSLFDKDEKPLLLLLLLVMEVLTPKAHLMPRTQHPVLMKKLAAIDPALKDYAQLAQERFDKFQVESFAQYKKDADDNNEKLYMRMNYMFKIREETEGVVYLKETIRLCNKENIPIVLYIPPVNYMQGERFFGDEFKTRYEENFNKLYGFLSKDGLMYDTLDTSYMIPETNFAAVNTIDETTNYEGREKLLDTFMKSEQLKILFKGGSNGN